MSNNFSWEPVAEIKGITNGLGHAAKSHRPIAAGLTLRCRRIKRRIRSMLGFKSISSARVIIDGIEMVHIMRKRQARFAHNPRPSIAEQFEILAA